MPKIHRDLILLYTEQSEVAASGMLRVAQHGAWVLYAGWLTLSPVAFFAVESNGPAALETFLMADKLHHVVLHFEELDTRNNRIRVVLGTNAEPDSRWAVLTFAKTLLEE